MMATVVERSPPVVGLDVVRPMAVRNEQQRVAPSGAGEGRAEDERVAAGGKPGAGAVRPEVMVGGDQR